MAESYKNFWSLNPDEVVVAGILRKGAGKGVEVLMPLNAQLKDVDLVLMNMKTRKFATVQVKGSRAYEPRKNEVKEFGEGSASWFSFPTKKLDASTADFFVFLVNIIERPSKGRRPINPHTITIPTERLKQLAKTHKPHGAKYDFYFWINPKTKEAFDFRDKKYFVSEFLDEKGIAMLNKKLA